jgi:cellulose synthase/poly-beta-1,6-N-acetylglucosamine synthase-like glycosyltransferase
MLELSYWIIAGLLIHTYLLFPLSLPVLVELFRRKRTYGYVDDLPRVSIIISAYNEEAVIADKIRNCLELDYPADKLEILIGNDGSTDRTAEIIAQFPQVHFVNAEKNSGKAAMLNRLQKEAVGDILLFCDANTLFFPNVARKIVQPFQDAQIGCVCGHLILNDASQSALGEGESAYWDLESEIKKFEGQLDRLIGGNGAVYAIRKELYSVIPTRKSVMDDFYVTVRVLQKGYCSTFIPSVIGTEQTSKAASGEFKRKIRIGRANYNYLLAYLPLLNPLRPLVAYLFASHKLLRWFSPHLILAMLVVNLILVNTRLVYQITLAALLLLFLLGAAGAFLAGRGRKTLFTSAPYYFLGMNWALFRGFFLAFLPEKSGGWVRVERSGEVH